MTRNEDKLSEVLSYLEKTIEDRKNQRINLIRQIYYLKE